VNEARPVRLLVLGTGAMANHHAEAFSAMPGVRLVAGVDPVERNLESFGRKWGIERGFSGLEAAIEWGEFDAATNVTPDAAHYSTTMALIAARKHVLCEKPLATDHASALDMARAAQAAGLVNMVNLTYRNVPALQKAADLVREGAIGAIRHFEASYMQSWLTQPAWGEWSTDPRWLWRLSKAHGSKGVLGDIGIHILDFATYVAGEGVADLSCRLKTFGKAPGDRIGDYRLDANDGFVMHVGLTGGAIGTVSASRFSTGHFNDLRVRIYGLKGGLDVAYEKRVSRLRACIGGDVLTETWTEIEAPEVATVYARFVGAVRGGPVTAPTFTRGAELQECLDLSERSDAEGSRILSTSLSRERTA